MVQEDSMTDRAEWWWAAVWLGLFVAGLVLVVVTW